VENIIGGFEKSNIIITVVKSLKTDNHIFYLTVTRLNSVLIVI
jgi:hypothetical protein